MSHRPIDMDGAQVYFIDDINVDDERSDPELSSSSSTANTSTETLTESVVHGK
ncbi:hypothetical protein FS749_009930 [Ceratobasidium sp. UAMH 11750]|nr:hypothetical protein FS749_009930 [Ceratobasidium sp. UAMH 11750]